MKHLRAVLPAFFTIPVSIVMSTATTGEINKPILAILFVPATIFALRYALQTSEVRQLRGRVSSSTSDGAIRPKAGRRKADEILGDTVR